MYSYSKHMQCNEKGSVSVRCIRACCCGTDIMLLVSPVSILTRKWPDCVLRHCGDMHIMILPLGIILFASMQLIGSTADMEPAFS